MWEYISTTYYYPDKGINICVTKVKLLGIIPIWYHRETIVIKNPHHHAKKYKDRNRYFSRK